MKKRIVLSALACLAACRDAKPARQEEPKETQTALVVPAEQLAVLDEARAALAETAKRSPLAKELLDFYDANAIPALSTAVGVQVVRAPKDERFPFFVATGPSVPRDPNGSFVFAEFHCHPFPVMTVYDHRMSAIAKGMMMAHELSHARDCLLHGEPPSEPLSDTWLLGELNGYVTSMTVLDQASDGKWYEAAAKSLTRITAKKAAAGKPLESLSFGLEAEDIALVESVFGKMDQTSLDAICTQLEVGVNIVNIRLQGAVLGKSQDEILGYTIGYLRIYFQQHR